MDIFKYLEKIGYNNTTDQFEHHIIEYAKSENIPYLSPEKGKFLSFITKLKNPFKCLEIGLGSGYSTYKILKSLGKNGKLISIDFNFLATSKIALTPSFPHASHPLSNIEISFLEIPFKQILSSFLAFSSV